MRKQKAGASWNSSTHVIKKLIRRLFGQESPPPQAPDASITTTPLSDDVKPARKSTRKKAAPAAPKRDPNVPVIPAEQQKPLSHRLSMNSRF